ncbi:MAG: Imm6 family immunity protein [Thermoactinomyces vulgaris]
MSRWKLQIHTPKKGGKRAVSWYTQISEEARVAYLLSLTEKILEQVTKGTADARKTVDMCWAWVEEKKYDGGDLYSIFVNEEDGGVSMFYEEAVDEENSQQARIWLCINYALEYTIWQAYKFEYGHDNYVPQPIEIVDDGMIDEFAKEIAKADGYREEWSERLQQYLLENYPAGSSKKIKREELLQFIA